MIDHISILKDRLAKAEAKVQRYRKTLESAENELSDIQTALRVLGDIGGESPTSVKASQATSTVNRQQEIADLLGVGSENGDSPIQLFERYQFRGGSDINIDTFRTTIWRMKGKAYVCSGEEYLIKSEDGKYWKSLKSQEYKTAGSSMPHKLLNLEHDL